MDDAVLCARLRAPAYWMSGSSDGHEGENDAARIAADAIERLTRERDEARAENQRLRDALKPFASPPPFVFNSDADYRLMSNWDGSYKHTFSTDDFRRARAALNPENPNGD